jgi:hypothetical protein
MKMFPSILVALLLTAETVYAINFPFENIQLQPSDIRNNSDLIFGNGSSIEKPECKSFPGYEGWPSNARWNALNVSIGGALLKGIPPAAACYEGEFKDISKCDFVKRKQNDALFACVQPLLPMGAANSKLQ